MGMELPRGVERRVLVQAGATVRAVLLDPPPSTNNLFDTFIRPRKKGPVRGRYGNLQTVRPKTKEYEAWIAAQGPAARRLRSPASYPVRLRYTAVGKWYKARDLGNVEKPVTDLLVAEGVLGGDNLTYVTGVVLDFEPSEAPPRVRVQFREVSAGLFGDEDGEKDRLILALAERVYIQSQIMSRWAERRR